MNFYHVDVFSAEPLSGNGLTVIFHEEDLAAPFMQRVAQEFKQFETIFLRRTAENRFRARIFTIEEELDFAGHPILGAASAIHRQFCPDEASIDVTFELNSKTVQSQSTMIHDCYRAVMNQGVPEFLGMVEGESAHLFLRALNLASDQLRPGLPMEVVSTGLPYLIVPIISGLDRAKITVGDLESKLGTVHAKFAYLFDVVKMEGRTWNNPGTLEDVATGSAAGPVAAYLFRRNIFDKAESITISQGRFIGRPSAITVRADPDTGEIFVSGDVRIIAQGTLLTAGIN
jgi:PhzF family phenazine biosynthesis protein